MPQLLPTTKQSQALRQLLGPALLAQRGEEYLCPPGQLIAPQGRLPQKKLALMRRFETACPHWQAQPLTGANIDLAYALERRWQSQQEAPDQLDLVRRCFREYKSLGLVGCLLLDGHKPLAYAMALPLAGAGAAILILRALPTPAGVTAVLYRELALLLQATQPGLQWVNLGFFGGELEQQNRLSYQPTVDKDSLRRLARAARAALASSTRYHWDDALTKALLAQPAYRDVQRLYCTISTPDEVSTQAVVAHALHLGKEVAIPRWRGEQMEFCLFTHRGQLVQDRLGFWQPPDDAPLAPPLDDSRTLCIVPALLVDRRGYRLGYGGGYYDRFLAGYRGLSVALAYPTMLRKAVPREDFDRPVDLILTTDCLEEKTCEQPKT